MSNLHGIISYRSYYLHAQRERKRWLKKFLLTNGAEGPSAQPLGLDVVGLEPESLQLRMIVRAEGVALQDPVELLELAPMEGDDRLGLEHTLMPVQPGARRQRP